MALTLYISHVIIGIGGILLLGLEKGQSLYIALLCTAVFSIGAIFACFLWQKRFARGPLERFMRFATKT